MDLSRTTPFTSIFLNIIVVALLTTPLKAGAEPVPAIEEIAIQVETTAWHDLQRAGPRWQQRVACEIDTIPCAISFHGSPRSRRDASRPSYRVELADKTIILKSESYDPAMMREWLGLRLFQQAGILSPTARPALLTINNRQAGVFIKITAVDQRRITALFPETVDRAALYYGYYRKAGEKRIRPDLRRSSDPHLYALAYEEIMRPAEAASHAPLDTLLSFLNSRADDREACLEMLDLNQWTTWFAASEIMANRDSPWYSGSRNYSLFLPPGGRWQILPWDPDHIFEDKGEFFPKSMLTGLRQLTGAEWFRQDVRKKTARLLRHELSVDRILDQVRQMAAILATPIRDGMVAGLHYRQWQEAVGELQRHIKKRHRLLLRMTAEQ